jgi:twinkle protein
MSLKEKIIEAKQIYNDKAAHLIAEELNIENWDSEKLKGCCPFHKEDTPSFIWNKKDNFFKCFGCGRVYSILDHYQRSGLSYIEAVKKLFNETGIIFEEFSWNEKEDYFRHYKYPQEETNTDRSKVEKYMSKRGISIQTLDYADIKQNKDGDIVFEHRNIDGKLLCTKYRPSRAVKKNETKMWWQKNASTCPILYGVDRIDITQSLLIVEGHMDRLACIEAGYTNVVSIPHGAEDLNWIEFNWEFLENFDTIILWSDNDDPGRKMIKESVVRIGEHRCKIVEPDDVVENSVRQYYKNISSKLNINKTDANNVLLACGKQEVLNLINNAKEVPIPDVIKLMECKEFDITNAEVLPTGTKDLDRHIYGYVEGTLNIWTGKTSSGKSTYIIKSCINEAINKGYGTFIYSGELTSSQLKNWVILQLAGREHIIEWDNGENKPKTYTVTYDAKKEIEEKYNDLIYIYDSYLIATPDKVISRMEYMRKKHGIKNFIIDNLMCFELDIIKHGNELNAQKNLMIQFLQFAVRYNAIVHLVAHPRKPTGEIALTEYDILGSSNIPNLAHRIFSIKRTSEKERKNGDIYDVYVSILKDRLLGVNQKSVGLYYDIPSRRMYGDKDDVNEKYSWDTGKITYKTKKFSKNGTLVSSIDEEEKEVFG